MSTSTREPQTLIELGKKDLGIMLAIAAIAPVLCFSAGLFTAFALDETSVASNTGSTDITANSATTRTLPAPVALRSANNHSLPLAPVRILPVELRG